MNEKNKKYNSLVEAQEIIDEYVNRFYPKKYKTREPILDGITDVERYLNSKLKICWVLKEPYDGYKGKGGGFCLKEMLINDFEYYAEKVQAFRQWLCVKYALVVLRFC